MAKTAKYEVVSGTRTQSGAVLKTFSSEDTHACGGAATACLRWFDRAQRKPNAQPMFFRKVA